MRQITFTARQVLNGKIFLEAHSENTKFNVVRFGNVACSHGSVFAILAEAKV